MAIHTWNLLPIFTNFVSSITVHRSRSYKIQHRQPKRLFAESSRKHNAAAIRTVSTHYRSKYFEGVKNSVKKYVQTPFEQERGKKLYTRHSVFVQMSIFISLIKSRK